MNAEPSRPLSRPPASRRSEGTQSIARALSLLRVVATGGSAGLGLSEIAALSQLSRPTVHRILSVLVAEGVVEQRPKTRRYALGVELQHLALSRTARAPLLKVAERSLGEIAAAIGDTVFLTLRSNLDTICVARRLGSYPIQVLVLNVGDRRPLGVSSAGLALLSTLPEPDAARILADNEVRIRSHGTTPAAALDQVRHARERGFAFRSPGLVPGTRAVSVAIPSGGGGGVGGGGGEAVGALTVAGVPRRLGAGRLESVVDELRRQIGSFRSGDSGR